MSTAYSNVIGLIEPEEKLMDSYHLAGAASLVCPDAQGSIPFQLLNLSDKPITVFRGATLGNFHRTDFEILPPTDLPDCKEKTSVISSVAQTPPEQTLTQSSVDACLSLPSSSPCNPPQQPATNQFCPPNLDRNTSVLPADEQNSLSRLLGEFSDVFAESTTELGRPDVIHHKTNVGDHPPVPSTTLWSTTWSNN